MRQSMAPVDTHVAQKYGGHQLHPVGRFMPHTVERREVPPSQLRVYPHQAGDDWGGE